MTDIGMDNLEVDWFLKGKLPDLPSPFSETKNPFIGTTPITDSATTSPPTTATSLSTVTSSSITNSNGNTLKRSKSISCRELEQIKKQEPTKKQGFFRSFFKSKTTNASSSGIKKIPVVSTQSTTTTTTSNNNTNELRRTKSLGYHDELDPKLGEFLRYYKTKGISQLQSDMNPISSTKTKPCLNKKVPNKVDTLGRPIPPHPDLINLPSAFAKNPKYNNNNNNNNNNNSSLNIEKPIPQDHSKLSFLKKKVIPGDSQSVISQTSSTIRSTPEPLIIPGLDDLPALRRVSFDIPVFYNDPPQQIPSRNPRKGEVEVCLDGTIIIHKLTLAEKKKLMMREGGGIVVGGSGHLKILKKEEDEETNNNNNNNEEEEEEEEEDVSVSCDASKISIDKPMVHHTKSTASLLSLAQDEFQNEIFPPLNTKVPLDLLYTRCCHLREILPIPATLKQIKKDSFDPIPLLQLRNPKPSLVEVLTFADFISIAPILCISLDGVSLSLEMFRIILTSLVKKPELEKLTLRNTPINHQGWKFLCWFLTKNHTLSRLDLTQVPTLTTNVQKPSKVSTSTGIQIERMECDLSSRSEMNWSLFNIAIMARNGIEELVLNGAKMSEIQFKDLFELGLSLKTTKLGLAYNRLTMEQCKVLGKWMDWEKLIGLDLGYNNLCDGKISQINELICHHKQQQKFLFNPQLRFISLNSNNLKDDEEVSEFLSTLIGFKELRYIDLSNNPKLFPNIITSLSENLPLLPNLSRLHLDYNDLSTACIISIAELIPFCKRLNFFSLMGSKLDVVSSMALLSSIKLSRSLITLDIEFEQIPLKTREEITVYTMRNMQNQVDDDASKGHSGNFSSLQEQLTALIHSGTSSDGIPDSQLVNDFLIKITSVRSKIHESIDELFKQRVQGGLNLEGKEALIRFCFIDSSIEKGLKLIKKKLNLTTDQIKVVNSALPKEKKPASLSNYVDSQGHTELFPFGVVDNQHNHDHEDQEITHNSTASDPSRLTDDYHIKEEASMLKLSSLIKNNESTLRSHIQPDHIDAIMAISGDELKDALLKTNNIQDLVKILDSLKDKGIPLGQIYKKQKDKNGDELFMDSETLDNTNMNSIGENTKCCVVDQSKKKKFLIGYDDESDNDDLEKKIEKKIMVDSEDAYDEVLDHLKKGRKD